MARRASSVSELDQIARVQALLREIGTTPAPHLEITTANGNAFKGHLLRDTVGNKQTAKGWNSYGSICLATEVGKIEIDYLDIVTIHRKPTSTPKVSVWLRAASAQRR
jgi:hypothetical protein